MPLKQVAHSMTIHNSFGMKSEQHFPRKRKYNFGWKNVQSAYHSYFLLPACLLICLSVYMSLRRACLSSPVYLTVYQSCLPNCLPVRLHACRLASRSVFLLVGQYTCLSAIVTLCQPVYLLVGQYTCLSASLPACRAVCLLVG